MSKDQKNYNKTVIALWGTKNGNHLSMPVDARSYDQIQEALNSVEIGGKFIVKKLSEEARAKFKNPENAPHYFLEYITKESVQEYEKAHPRQRGNEGGL